MEDAVEIYQRAFLGKDGFSLKRSLRKCADLFHRDYCLCILNGT
jgi:hypothetical protein